MYHQKCILKDKAPAVNSRTKENPEFVTASLKGICITIVALFSLCCIKSTSAANQAEIKILHVNSHLIDCVGAGPRKCMQIRESRYDEWHPFYDEIEGFTFEEGYLYQIIVSITDVEDPPADGSSKAYELLAIVSRKKV